MAFVCVEGAVGGDAGDLLLSWDLVEQLGQHWRIADVAGGELGRPEFQCFSSIPMWNLRQTLRFMPPCLRSFHSPSPSTLIPVLSTSRWNGPPDPRYGMSTVKVFWRRDSVLKSGTAQSSPVRRTRLPTNPVVWRSAMPNRPGAPPVQG